MLDCLLSRQQFGDMTPTMEAVVPFLLTLQCGSRLHSQLQSGAAYVVGPGNTFRMDWLFCVLKKLTLDGLALLEADTVVS